MTVVVTGLEQPIYVGNFCMHEVFTRQLTKLSIIPHSVMCMAVSNSLFFSSTYSRYRLASAKCLEVYWIRSSLAMNMISLTLPRGHDQLSKDTQRHEHPAVVADDQHHGAFDCGSPRRASHPISTTSLLDRGNPNNGQGWASIFSRNGMKT